MKTMLAIASAIGISTHRYREIFACNLHSLLGPMRRAIPSLPSGATALLFPEVLSQAQKSIHSRQE
jgi:hypothetical protein